MILYEAAALIAPMVAMPLHRYNRVNFKHVPVLVGRPGAIKNTIPRRKGTRIRAVYYRKYADFTLIFACTTAQYRPKMFISGVIENKS